MSKFVGLMVDEPVKAPKPVEVKAEEVIEVKEVAEKAEKKPTKKK